MAWLLTLVVAWVSVLTPVISMVRLTNNSGGFVLQLLPIYPRLRFVVQDRPENVERGEREIFPAKAPDALANGRVKFMAHDFFNANPVQNADVYWLRGILYVSFPYSL